MQLTEEYLKSISWQDISILELDKDEYVLILLCNNIAESEKLLQALKTNAFHLNVFVNRNTRHYSFRIDFVNSEYSIGFNSNLTKERYFPLTWLANNKVTSITTGIKKATGDLQYNKSFYPLDGISLN